jgi:hypothetical protein
MANNNSNHSPTQFSRIRQNTKGTYKKQCQGVRSTRVQDEMEMTLPALPKMNDIYIKIYNATETMNSDQTRCFPTTSSRGNKYIMVIVKVDGNYIDAEPMKNKSEGAMMIAYIALWTRLTGSRTVKPMTHILDNEASEEFKGEIQKNCTIQLVPPDNTDKILQNEQYKPSKITSKQY